MTSDESVVIESGITPATFDEEVFVLLKRIVIVRCCCCAAVPGRDVFVLSCACNLGLQSDGQSVCQTHAACDHSGRQSKTDGTGEM